MAIETSSSCENLCIDLGDCPMSKKKLELAKKIQDGMDNKRSTNDLCTEFKLNRALLYKYAYLTTIRDDVIQRFLDGKCGLVPLVDLHKKFGNEIGMAIDAISKSRINKGVSKKATYNEVQNHLTSKTPYSPKAEGQGQGQGQGHGIATVPARESIYRINKVLQEACFVSQISSGVLVDHSDLLSIQRRLAELEQWLDELNPDEVGEQGDPTDQSLGSYTFPNMVNSDSEFKDFQYSIEDENQDIYTGEYSV